jgi:RimJ/RimL family protein N-acetyltransferase
MHNQADKPIIETINLQLIPCELSHIEAIMRDKKELEQMLDIKVPPKHWPEFPESIPHVYELLKSDSSSPEWGYHLFIHAKDRALVGEGGYKGGPDKEGIVEIGYAIIPAYRRRGLALEAARALTRHAFSHPEVNSVQAHTLPDGAASISLLKKLGMKFVGTFNDPEDGEVLRWSVERKDYLAL